MLIYIFVLLLLRGQPPLEWPRSCCRDSHSAADRVRLQSSEEDANKEEHTDHLGRVKGQRMEICVLCHY